MKRSVGLDPSQTTDEAVVEKVTKTALACVWHNLTTMPGISPSAHPARHLTLQKKNKKAKNDIPVSTGLHTTHTETHTHWFTTTFKKSKLFQVVCISTHLPPPFFPIQISALPLSFSCGIHICVPTPSTDYVSIFLRNFMGVPVLRTTDVSQ